MKAVVDNWCKDDVTGESSQPPVSGGASRSQKQQSVAAKQSDKAGRRGRSTPPLRSLLWLPVVILKRDNLTTTLRLLLSTESSV